MPECKGSKFNREGKKTVFSRSILYFWMFLDFFVFSAWERKNDLTDLAR